MRLFTLILASVLSFGSAASAAEKQPTLLPWSPALFERAAREKKLVLLDLGAVWCHWCHVMDETTYRDPAVLAELDKHYLVARVDQDASPDLSARYGEYGWPATIILTADGRELVKRRGYFDPAHFLSILEAVAADPKPGPSVKAEAEWRDAPTGALAAADRQRMETTIRDAFDDVNAGFGLGNRYLDFAEIEYAIERGRDGDAAFARMARRTLDAARALADPVWGGIDQYSDSHDWKSPHFEKIVSTQTQAIRAASLAYRIGNDPKDLAFARGVVRYLDRFMTSPEGAIYTSQDADLDDKVDGHAYYALDDAGRTKLGIPPIDKHIYPRENGWFLSAMASLYAATGDRTLIERALTAADTILAQRSLGQGGFRHDASQTAYLADTLAMADGFLALYGVTGDRVWLGRAEAGARFIEKTFRDGKAGYATVKAAGGTVGVFRKVHRDIDENAALARFANRLYRATGKAPLRAMADHAMRYLASPTILAARPYAPATLLADRELAHEPLHVTVVGHTDDPAAAALWTAALRLPSDYARTEWWDRRKGPLPRSDIEYPDLGHAAAFACTDRSCSLPITDPARIVPALNPPTN